MSRMEIACNYSTPLAKLLAEDRIEVDWIKTHDLRLVEACHRASGRVLIHRLPYLGDTPDVVEDFDWAHMSDQLQEAGSPHCAAHLEIEPAAWSLTADRTSRDAERDRRIISRFISNATSMKQRLAVPLHLENVPFYGRHGTMRIACEPETVCEVSEVCDVPLLLDLSHARCAAFQLGVDIHDYLRALPLATVVEIHVNGPRMIEGQGLVDCHQWMMAEDYALLDWTLAQIRPQILTLEYGGTGERFGAPERNDVDLLEEQLLELQRRTG